MDAELHALLDSIAEDIAILAAARWCAGRGIRLRDDAAAVDRINEYIDDHWMAAKQEAIRALKPGPKPPDHHLDFVGSITPAFEGLGSRAAAAAYPSEGN